MTERVGAEHVELPVDARGRRIPIRAWLVKSRTSRAIQTLRGTGLFVSTEDGIHP